MATEIILGTGFPVRNKSSLGAGARLRRCLNSQPLALNPSSKPAAASEIVTLHVLCIHALFFRCAKTSRSSLRYFLRVAALGPAASLFPVLTGPRYQIVSGTNNWLLQQKQLPAFHRRFHAQRQRLIVF